MEQQLYYDEREKGRGNSMNSQRNRAQMPPSPRYGGVGSGAGGRNSYRGDRHTVDRERFPKYNEPDEYLDEEREPQMHVPRRDRMRENNVPPIQSQRHLMRHSEDRQMNGSPNVRQQQHRGGAGNVFFFNFHFHVSTIHACNSFSLYSIACSFIGS